MTTWWAQATGAVTYVRNDLPARYLPGVVKRLEPVVHLDSEELMMNELFGDPVSIWSFPANQMRARLMAHQRARGVKVLVEVDDLYLTLPQIRGDHWQYKIDMTADKHSVEAHMRIIHGVTQAVIVSTDRMAREYREHHHNVHVCENTIDPIDWQYEKPDDGIFRIGFAGSMSHIVDIGLILPALEWANKQKGVKAYVYGSVGDRLPWLHTVPWTDTLEDYRKSLFRFDVGLCPLLSNRWADCKSDVKALEYTMAGALPIVSQVEPYRAWIGGPGLSAATKQDFTKLVKWCVANQDEVKRLARECKDHVLRERTIHTNVWKWQTAIDSVEAEMASNMTGVPKVPTVQQDKTADNPNDGGRTFDKGIVVQDRPIDQGGSIPDPKGL